VILIVDDHHDNRRALSILLKMEGFETCTAASGKEALFTMQSRIPHCIILDFNMPEMDGLEVLQRIRSDPCLAHIRVIIFSAMGRDLKDEAMAAGADAVVEKCTLDFNALRREVMKHCQPTTEPAPMKSPDECRRCDAG
jgi:CheY-like chemotaxis protein